MIVIGINSGFDYQMNKISGGGCALLKDGIIIQAIAEERLSRIKHDGGFRHSLKHILTYNHLTKNDVDYFCISFYGNSFCPSKKLIDFHLNELGLKKTPHKLVVIPSHHLSHAYLSYFLSPYSESLIFVSDNEGSILFKENKSSKDNFYERNTYYWATENCINFIERDFEVPGSVGFGKAYNKFTRFIGFGDYHNAGKTMGLSAYGTIPNSMRDLNLWEIDSAGRLQSYMDNSGNNKKDIICFFKKFEISLKDSILFNYNSKEARDLAAYIQGQLEKWTLLKTKHLLEKTKMSNVCYGGGVALNSVVNSIVNEKLDTNVFVPPFPSDEGQALGNAIYCYINKNDFNNNTSIKKICFKNFLYLGKQYGETDFQKAFKKYKNYISVSAPQNIYQSIALLLNEQNIIGVFNQKSEYGARALGNRSIIASPIYESLRDKINILKKRELFRPLAPSVLEEHAANYFLIKDATLFKGMLGVAKVLPSMEDKIKGVVHADKTARVQIVSMESNKKFYEIISNYYKISGIPMVINTSFNLAEEPIVETPSDAINTFLKMKLDALVIDNYLIFPNGKQKT